MIKRLIEDLIFKNWNDRKAVIVYGPRQSGKTTLVRSVAEKLGGKTVFWDGDDFALRSALKEISSASLLTMTASADLLVIDEAQRVDNIGLLIKIIVDNKPDMKVLATGSSAFDLSGKINEPMTGRKREYLLLPFSFMEMVNENSRLTEKSLLNHRLVFGYYPEVVNNPGKEKDILFELADSYLYKDILILDKVNKPEKLERLIRAIAFQLGNEVSYNELGKMAGLDNQTVERYIDLLEKSYIIFRIGSLSRNMRNELKKSRKIYFYDNGIRNAIIASFNNLEMRADAGALWENFIVCERFKYLKTHNIFCNRYFWRTTAQQEIDYIEESEGTLSAYEFRWNPKVRSVIPSSFVLAYPGSETRFITPGNMESFLGV